MSHNKLGNLLTIPAHIAYWILGVGIVLNVVGDWAHYDLSTILPEAYYEKIHPYSKAASAILILSLLVVILNQFISRRNEHVRWRHVFEELHTALDAVSAFRDEISQRRSEISTWNRQDADNFQTFAVLKYREVATRICNLFCAYTETECHVSFKTLDSQGRVSTVARDQRGGSAERARIDEHLKSFACRQNTAFCDILEKDKVDCYISNRLLWLSRLGWYKNANEDWHTHYRAVAVAPITTEAHPANINRNNVYGFLCVDNQVGGFDNGVCRELLTHVARHLHKVTVLLAQVHIGNGLPNDQKGNPRGPGQSR